MKKIFLLIIVALFLFGLGNTALAHQPRIIYSQEGDVKITEPEIAQSFYDELTGEPRNYFIKSEKDFVLYVNLLVPKSTNSLGRYSAKIFLINNNVEELIGELDGPSFEWQDFYEKFGRDYYLKGPELERESSAGEYKIQVFSEDNEGRYVLSIGKIEYFDFYALVNIYWQIPLLKISFFETSVLQFFITPFGIGLAVAVGFLLIFLSLIYYIIGLIRQTIKHRQAKTLLLASTFTEMKDEIIKLLQKPSYDITVGFITTAAKPLENIDYLKSDWEAMRDELRFNIEEIDIEGKKESEVMKLLRLKDIIFVEGGNTYYLLKAMRKCNFERILRKLLKKGKVYIGISAGAIVAGKSIKLAGWLGDKNTVDLKNLKGLNFVPFDIFPHYVPRYEEVIKQNIKNPKKRAKNLKIITDQQGILVQGKEVTIIGDGTVINI